MKILTILHGVDINKVKPTPSVWHPRRAAYTRGENENVQILLLERRRKKRERVRKKRERKTSRQSFRVQQPMSIPGSRQSLTYYRAYMKGYRSYVEHVWKVTIYINWVPRECPNFKGNVTYFVSWIPLLHSALSLVYGVNVSVPISQWWCFTMLMWLLMWLMLIFLLGFILAISDYQITDHFMHCTFRGRF